MIDRADAAVHSLCTRFSHALQRATGLTCYFVARVGIAIAAVNILADSINFFVRFLPKDTDIVSLACSGLLLWFCVRHSINAQKADDSVGSGVKPAELIMYEGPLAALWRMLWIGFFVYCLFTPDRAHLWLSFVQDAAFPLGFGIFYNFIVVNPLPPGTSKLREWLKGFTSTPELARQEN